MPFLHGGGDVAPLRHSIQILIYFLGTFSYIKTSCKKSQEYFHSRIIPLYSQLVFIYIFYVLGW